MFRGRIAASRYESSLAYRARKPRPWRDPACPASGCNPSTDAPAKDQSRGFGVWRHKREKLRPGQLERNAHPESHDGNSRLICTLCRKDGTALNASLGRGPNQTLSGGRFQDIDSDDRFGPRGTAHEDLKLRKAVGFDRVRSEAAEP